MKSRTPVASARPSRALDACSLLLCLLGFASLPAHAQTLLSDTPVLLPQTVPGNVALPLSVEYPTVERVAHTVAYDTTTNFLGYFDPAKCYTYNYDAVDTAARPALVTNVSYFQPAGLATNHVCVGKWSGNFLNWAMTHTIDPFRWGLTGGFRVVDTPTLTVLEKVWSPSAATGHNLFPDRSISGVALISGATPFNFANLSMRIQGMGNKMRFTGSGNLGTAGTPYAGGAATPATVYEVFARARVCDSAVSAGGPEANCIKYGTNWKPEGLIQKYSAKMRFSAFGYLNQDGNGRDGGVLRARQKFVAPLQPVPGSTPITNVRAEWNPLTGVFVDNPDADDATATNLTYAPSSLVKNSGVMNYLNKFGEIAPTAGYTFKSNDPVSELYYATIRYFKNLGSVPAYSAMTGGTPTDRTTWIDGFPVIDNWVDPVQYSCQRNFILGIGDIYTHADKNLPGSGTGTSLEPTKPGLVSGDNTVDSVIATNKVFALQGLGAPNPNDYSGRSNSAGIAGLAYDSHTKDIRPDLAGMQTIDTYWVDVLENPFVANNQFYLAAKYGGFAVPTGYGDPYARTAALPDAWWHTAAGAPDTNLVGAQLRPDNYFTGGRPDQMVAGLNQAFDRIAAQISAFTTSFATTLPQVAQTGNSSYSSQYDGSNWTGEITASRLDFDAAGNPSTTDVWKFTDRLATQLAGTGWKTDRRIATWNGSAGAQFCTTGVGCTIPISAAQLAALDPLYVVGGDSANYLDYLRGDRKNEQSSTVAGSTNAYRNRAKLLGDVIGSKARPVGPPSFPFTDASNPGYAKFKSDQAGRPTVVYVGSNDGMLHAIRGDLTATGGTEMFAYVPNALFQGPNNTPSVDGLASLGNPSFVHHFMVNAAPNVYDVDFARTVGGSGAPDWRSILIGGLGKGGRSYYAIDVTNPEAMATSEATVASKVLWEVNGKDLGHATGDVDLGYTYGDPIVVKTVKYGWVVIIPSGYNNVDGQGHFLILNPRTGAVLERVATGAGTLANPAGLGFANAFVVDATDGTADAVYAGDLLGNLWRWDVTAATGSYPAPLLLAKLTSSDVGGAAQPVTSRPVIEVHPGLKKRFVMVGTGRLLDTSDLVDTQNGSFYAIADGTNARFNSAADLPGSISFPITRAKLGANNDVLRTDGTPAFNPLTQIGWVEDLGAGWRVTTDATTLLGAVAWAGTLPSGDVCTTSSANGRVYGRDFGTDVSTIGTLSGGTLTVQNYITLLNVKDQTPTTVTDLRYISVNGKATLIAGTASGGNQGIGIPPQGALPLRRLNWRELQIAD